MSPSSLRSVRGPREVRRRRGDQVALICYGCGKGIDGSRVRNHARFTGPLRCAWAPGEWVAAGREMQPTPVGSFDRGHWPLGSGGSISNCDQTGSEVVDYLGIKPRCGKQEVGDDSVAPPRPQPDVAPACTAVCCHQGIVSRRTDTRVLADRERKRRPSSASGFGFPVVGGQETPVRGSWASRHLGDL